MITQTRSGKVEGYEDDGVAVFKGIPYAAPPIGARRWMAPEREDAWDDVRDTTAFSPHSAQGAFAMNAMLGGPEPVVSEDSLYLNVWTPACDDATVWVWTNLEPLSRLDDPTLWTATTYCMSVERRIKILSVSEAMARASHDDCLRRVAEARAAASAR